MPYTDRYSIALAFIAFGALALTVIVSSLVHVFSRRRAKTAEWQKKIDRLDELLDEFLEVQKKTRALVVDHLASKSVRLLFAYADQDYEDACYKHLCYRRTGDFTKGKESVNHLDSASHRLLEVVAVVKHLRERQ